MKIYREVLIESAEQAEALPPRTPVMMGPFVAHRPYADQGWVVTESRDEYGSEELIAAHSHLNPTALVPEPANVEIRQQHAVPASTFPGLEWPEQEEATMTRLTTNWRAS